MHPRSEYWVSSARLRLRAARLLFDEGLYDDCVNRCFFSAFHAALALLANEGLETRSYTGAFTQLFVHFVSVFLMQIISLRWARLIWRSRFRIVSR